MSSVIFATICLTVLSIAVSGTLGYMFGVQSGRARAESGANIDAVNRLTDTVIRLASGKPGTTTQPQQATETPRLVERPVHSGIFLGGAGDDPGTVDDEVMQIPRQTNSNVAASIPMGT